MTVWVVNTVVVPIDGLVVQVLDPASPAKLMRLDDVVELDPVK